MADSDSSSTDKTYSGGSESESSDSSETEKSKPVIIQSRAITVNKPPVFKRKIKKRKDRFFDKSRRIPNDVYFGDVKVPLSVLHTRYEFHDLKYRKIINSAYEIYFRWESDADSSDSGGHGVPSNGGAVSSGIQSSR